LLLHRSTRCIRRRKISRNQENQNTDRIGYFYLDTALGAIELAEIRSAGLHFSRIPRGGRLSDGTIAPDPGDFPLHFSTPFFPLNPSPFETASGGQRASKSLPHFQNIELATLNVTIRVVHIRNIYIYL